MIYGMFLGFALACCAAVSAWEISKFIRIARTRGGKFFVFQAGRLLIVCRLSD